MEADKVASSAATLLVERQQGGVRGSRQKQVALRLRHRVRGGQGRPAKNEKPGGRGAELREARRRNQASVFARRQVQGPGRRDSGNREAAKLRRRSLKNCDRQRTCEGSQEQEDGFRVRHPLLGSHRQVRGSVSVLVGGATVDRLRRNIGGRKVRADLCALRSRRKKIPEG